MDMILFYLLGGLIIGFTLGIAFSVIVILYWKDFKKKFGVK
jgi:hypothetical protein